ncbi:MAG TPA: MarR family transcriptional regulator [Polyangia bacterium]|jgi:DNA-binding MarR family transcriptional regulator
MSRRSDAADRELLDELGRLIPRARHRVWRHAAARLEGLGESIFYWPLLRRIMDHGGLSQCQLAQLTAQHPAAVSRSLEELEARRFVRRTRDARDRRRVLVELTARGRTHCQAVLPEILIAVEQALEPLSRPERLSLRDLLRKLVGPVVGPPEATAAPTASPPRTRISPAAASRRR